MEKLKIAMMSMTHGHTRKYYQVLKENPKLDWIAVSTDSHSSRRCVQQTALRYGVPLLSAGVSITVAKEGGRHRIVDESG